MCYLLGDPQYLQNVSKSGRKLPAVARFSRRDMKFHQEKVCGLTRVGDRLRDTPFFSTTCCSECVASGSKSAQRQHPAALTSA